MIYQSQSQLYNLIANLVIISCLYFIPLAVLSQGNLFTPSKSLNVRSFEITKHNTIVIIDQNQNTYYSKGRGFRKIKNGVKCQELIYDQDTRIIKEDSIYSLIDDVITPYLIGEKINGKKIIYQTNKDSYLMLNDTLISLDSGAKITIPYQTNHLISDNSVLIAGTDFGIKIYEANKWKTYRIPTLPNDIAVKSIALKGNKIVLSSKNKIYYFDTKEYDFDEYYHNKLITDISLDIDGNIWYLANNDLYFIQRNESVSSTLKIGKVLTKAINATPTDQYSLTSNDSAVSIHMILSELIPNNNNKHYYLLDKIDKEWQVLDKDIVKYNLSVGKNVFMIKTENGNESHITDKIIFKVKEAADHTWSYILSGIIGTLLLFSIVQYIVHKSKLKSLQNQIQLLRTKNTLNKTETKLNQLKINPHFLFNSLNSIQGLLLENDNNKTRSQLRNFALLMRQVLDSNDEDYLSISSDIKFLKQYLELEKMNHNNNFDYEITYSNDLDLSLKIPPMITQIPVENAIIHGMKDNQKDGHILINYKFDKDQNIIFTVEDNGAGISDSNHNHESKGTKIVKERLKGVILPYQLTNIMNNDQIIGCKATLSIKPKI